MAERVKRKISAILSADVAGYSRLMSEDEIGTVNRLKAYRKLIRVSVREHHGRVVDNPGDNILAEFPSALDATCCAVEIQGMLENRNTELPVDRRMDFRIGIHLSDVMVDGDRIYGDGVNIAARMEESSETGGICVSAAVHEQVKNKLDLDFQDIGEKEVKNLPDPVHAYQALLGYVAFISYSHRDAKWANWLAKSLESYRVPMKLVKGDSTLTYPKRLVPVFRGPEEPPASSSLSETIKGAISNSDAMIVICSPSAAQSQFVNEEILTFKRLGMGKKLLPLIVGGEPRSEEDECFPPSLKYKLDDSGNLSDDLDEEPIGADVRPGKDSRNTAKLKIIASLIGVGFDDLKQREARKKLKLMSGIAGAALAVMVLTTTLAVSAYYSKQEAQRRRAQAEDLIGFMLGDLRLQLEPIGRLDVLDAVGDKALEYFASLEDEELTPEALLGRAKALRQIGEVRMSQGNLDEALAAFRLSNDQALRLLDVYETPDPVQFEAGQSHFWIGYVHYERNEVELARRQFEDYLRLSQSLLNRDPNNAAFQKEVAYALTNLGTLELKVNRFDQASAHYREAESINRAIVAASPDDLGPKIDLAGISSWLGETAWRSGNIGSAAQWFRQEYELRTLIVSRSDDMHQVLELATAASWLARGEMLAGQLGSATRHLEEAHKLSLQLVRYDGENAWWRTVHAHTGVALSRVAAAKGDLRTALRHIDAAVADIGRFGDSVVFQTAKRHLLIPKALAQRALVLRLAGDARAHAAVQEALASVDDIDVHSDSEVAVIVAGLRLLEGDLCAESGDPSEAKASWSSGLALLDGLPDNLREPIGLMTRAALLDRTGSPHQAAELRAELARIGFRDSEDRELTYGLIGVR